MTIESLDNKFINSTNPNANYYKYYHYDIAISDAVNEFVATGTISEAEKEDILNKGYVSISQILDDDTLGSYSTFNIDLANVVLENVFVNILMENKKSNSTYEVNFYCVDAINGLIDVEVIQSSKYNAFKMCTTTERRTIIKDTYQK